MLSSFGSMTIDSAFRRLRVASRPRPLSRAATCIGTRAAPNGWKRPKPDHGEESYRGSGKLAGKKAVITGADSGIGRAVAIAYAREGADVLIAYLDEHEDAKETRRLVEDAGRKAVLVAGDIGSSKHCRSIVDKAVSELGGIDILV